MCAHAALMAQTTALLDGYQFLDATDLRKSMTTPELAVAEYVEYVLRGECELDYDSEVCLNVSVAAFTYEDLLDPLIAEQLEKYIDAGVRTRLGPNAPLLGGG